MAEAKGSTRPFAEYVVDRDRVCAVAELIEFVERRRSVAFEDVLESVSEIHGQPFCSPIKLETVLFQEHYCVKILQMATVTRPFRGVSADERLAQRRALLLDAALE